MTPADEHVGPPEIRISEAINPSTGVANDVMSPVSMTTSTSKPRATSCAKFIPRTEAWMSEMCRTRIASSARGTDWSDV